MEVDTLVEKKGHSLQQGKSLALEERRMVDGCRDRQKSLDENVMAGNRWVLLVEVLVAAELSRERQLALW